MLNQTTLLSRLAKHELSDADKAWCRELARLMMERRRYLQGNGHQYGGDGTPRFPSVAAHEALQACHMRAILDPHGIGRGLPQMETFGVYTHESREPVAIYRNKIQYTHAIFGE